MLNSKNTDRHRPPLPHTLCSPGIRETNVVRSPPCGKNVFDARITLSADVRVLPSSLTPRITTAAAFTPSDHLRRSTAHLLLTFPLNFPSFYSVFSFFFFLEKETSGSRFKIRGGWGTLAFVTKDEFPRGCGWRHGNKQLEYTGPRGVIRSILSPKYSCYRNRKCVLTFEQPAK